MRSKRILSYIVSFIFALTPFLISPQNLVFAESETTVSNYSELKDALTKADKTLIKLRPGRYILDEPLVIDHKVRLVGLSESGQKFNSDTILKEDADIILDGQNRYNIVVGVSAMLENLTLTGLACTPLTSVESGSFVDAFIPKFKERFGIDISKFRDYLVENGFNIQIEYSEGSLAEEWSQLLNSLFVDESLDQTVRENNIEEYRFTIAESLYELIYQGPLRINNGTVQNCRIINNKSDALSVVMIHGGTFFGNLVAFNTVSNSVPGNLEGQGGYSSVISEIGLSFVLNNTVAYNDSYILTQELENRSNDCDSISLYGQSFIMNNIIYNSGMYGIYNEQNWAEMICNNASNVADEQRFGNAFAENNISLTDNPFVTDPGLGDEAVPNRGYRGEEFGQLPAFDFAIGEAGENSVKNNGLDVFFDKIPTDMNGITRLNGDKPTIGAFECEIPKAAPSYSQGDVMYVSSNGSDENDGLSWEMAMASPEQAVINAARGNPRTVVISEGTYDIKGRVMLYIQKDGFSGGIWAGIVLSEGMKIYGGLQSGQSGSVQEQINSRISSQNPEAPWNFDVNTTTLRGSGPIRGAEQEEPAPFSQINFNPDYLGIRDGADWTQPGWTDNKVKNTTRVTDGIRIITQVEDFDASFGTKIDGVDLENGYTISRKEVTPSWPGVKKANQVGGAGALIRNGVKLSNSIVEKSYEALLYIYNEQIDETEQCGGGVMVSGGTVSGSLIKDNISESSGGGIFLMSGKVEDCAVENNVAFNMGGGIVTAHLNTLKPSSITHTSITGNSVIGVVPYQTNRFGIPYPSDPEEGKGIGGGAWIANNVTVDRVIFDGNLSKNRGDGLYVGTKSSTVAQAVVENSLITNHSAGNNQAVFMESGSLLDSNVIKNKNPIAVSAQNNAVVTGTVFWGNQNEIPAGINMTYSAAPGGYGEQTAMNLNLSTNNSDATGSNFVDSDAGDYHLLESSPLIGRNSPNDTTSHDYDMVERPQGDVTDIGMFEYAGKLEITFDGNGGIFGENSTSITKSVSQGSKIGDVKPENPVKNGYAFIGYTKVKDDISTQLEDSFTINGSMTVYAYYGPQNIQKTGDTDHIAKIVIGCTSLIMFSLGIYYFLKKKKALKAK